MDAVKVLGNVSTGAQALLNMTHATPEPRRTMFVELPHLYHRDPSYVACSLRCVATPKAAPSYQLALNFEWKEVRSSYALVTHSYACAESYPAQRSTTRQTGYKER
jgi:hypothetical protein